MNAPEDVLEVPGLGEAAVTEIKLVRAAALRLMRGEVLERPVLASWAQVLDYCRAAMGFGGQGAVPHTVVHALTFGTRPLAEHALLTERRIGSRMGALVARAILRYTRTSRARPTA
jgi:hypothetical protein